MVQVLDILTDVEAKEHLFSLRDRNGLPVWDVLRYDVMKHLFYKFSINKETVPHPTPQKKFLIFLKSIKPFFKLIGIDSPKILFYAHSRYQNADGLFYDRQAVDLINMIKPEDRIILDTRNGSNCEYTTYEIPQAFFYLLLQINNKLSSKYRLDKDVVLQIKNSINKSFGEEVINESTILSLYVRFIAQCKMFDWILRRTKPKKVIISYGRYKALSYVARQHNITTYLMQHSLIDISDATVGGTCPKREDGVNPDVFLTYGSYWGGYLKHLMDVQVIGNRFLYKDQVNIIDDGSVLFISSLYQGPFLSKLLFDLAPLYPQTKFIYKLHPGERNLRVRYEDLFKNNSNVKVYLDEESMDGLLGRCTLVVLISSTTLFEALNFQKCVAIYNTAEFPYIPAFLKRTNNTYCFSDIKEFDRIMKNHKFDKLDGLSYYDKFDKALAMNILDINKK